METAEQAAAEADDDGTGLDYQGLRSEILLVGIVLTVYLIGVVADSDGRRI